MRELRRVRGVGKWRTVRNGNVERITGGKGGECRRNNGRVGRKGIVEGIMGAKEARVEEVGVIRWGYGEEEGYVREKVPLFSFPFFMVS